MWLEIMFEVGSGSGHARSRRSTWIPRLMLLLRGSLIKALITVEFAGGIKHEILGQETSPPLREAHGFIVAGHGRGQWPLSGASIAIETCCELGGEARPGFRRLSEGKGGRDVFGGLAGWSSERRPWRR